MDVLDHLNILHFELQDDKKNVIQLKPFFVLAPRCLVSVFPQINDLIREASPKTTFCKTLSKIRGRRAKGGGRFQPNLNFQVVLVCLFENFKKGYKREG